MYSPLVPYKQLHTTKSVEAFILMGIYDNGNIWQFILIIFWVV